MHSSRNRFCANLSHAISNLASSCAGNAFRQIALLCMALTLLALPLRVSAQSIEFYGSFTEATQGVVTYGQGIVADVNGNVYITGTNNLLYMPRATNGTYGANTNHISSDGSDVYGLAIDSANNLYRADANGSVKKFTYNGTTIQAGNSPPDTANFTETTLGSGWSKPSSVVVDANFNVYVLDAGLGEIVELSEQASCSSTPSTCNSYTQTTLVTNSTLDQTLGMSRDSSGNFYVAAATSASAANVNLNSSVNKVYKIAAGTYTISEMGSGWDHPTGTAVDSSDNLWVADYGSGGIYLLTKSSGYAMPSGAFATISGLRTLTVSKIGQLFGVLADPAEIEIGGTPPHSTGTSQTGTTSTQTVEVNFTSQVTSFSYSVLTQGLTGKDFNSDVSSNCIQGHTYAAGTSCNIVVDFTPTAPGLREGAVVLTDLAGDQLGTNYLYGVGDAPEMAFTPAIINNFAGTGAACSYSSPGSICGDGGAATSAYLNSPRQTVVDPAGNIYVADFSSLLVRKISATDGTISTVAGNGGACGGGACGDGGAATSASIWPVGIALDGAGILYISDYATNRVRAVNPTTGIITNVAGTGDFCHSNGAACGDGGAATSALLSLTSGSSLAVDELGNLLIADTGDNSIRSVNLTTGIITTVAGTTGSYCSDAIDACGDGDQATSALLSRPTGIAVDANNNYLIADTNDFRIRGVSASTGKIYTIAGSGTQCTTYSSCGDGGASTSAELNYPWGVAADAAGNYYIADSNDYTIRWVTGFNWNAIPPSGTIHTLANTSGTACGGGNCGDGGAATSAEFDYPISVLVDNAGNLIISDASDRRLRRISVQSTPALSYSSTDVGDTSSAQTVTVNNIGNATLDFSALSYATDFIKDGSSCTSSLATGAACTLTIEFKPLSSGPFTESVILTDNNLNISPDTSQTVSVTGTGVNPADATTTTIAASATTSTYGQTVNITVTVADTTNTNTHPTGSVTITWACTGAAGTCLTGASGSVVIYSLVSGDSGTHTFSSFALPSFGTYTFAASYAGVTDTYSASDNSGQSNGGNVVKVSAATPDLAFAAISTKTYGVSPFSVSATDSSIVSGGTITYALTEGHTNAGTVSSDGTVVTVTGAGAIYLTATQAANGNYTSATATTTVTVNKATPSNVVSRSSGANPAQYNDSLTFKATLPSDATGSVTFKDGTTSLGTQPVSGGIATLTISTLSVATHSITAVYNGDNNYFGQTSNALSQVVKGLPVVTPPTASTINYPQPLLASTLTGGSAICNGISVPGTFAFTTPMQIVSGGATNPVSVTFTPTDLVHYDTVVFAVNISVNKVTPTVVKPTITLGYGLPLSAATLTGGSASYNSAAVAGTFTFTSPSTVPTALGAYATTMTFTPTLTGDYNNVTSIAVSVTVVKATPVVTWPTAGNIYYQQSLSAVILTGGTHTSNGATIPGAFAFNVPSYGPAVGISQQQITFTPSDTTHYLPVTGTVSVTTLPDVLTVTWPTATNIAYGQPLPSLALTGGSATYNGGRVSGIFYVNTIGSATGLGSITLSVTFLPSQATFATTTGSISGTVVKATPIISVKPTAHLYTSGQALSAWPLTGGTAVNPVSGAVVPGVFTFTTPSTLPGIGTPLEGVTFTPTNTTDYNTATTSVNVTVNQGGR